MPEHVRLLSVPARHPYVDAVRPLAVGGAMVESVAPDRVEQFAPDPFLTVAGVHRWGPESDVAHLHFGFDHLTPAGAREWTHALTAAGVPLVLTVHDLRNPHHAEAGAHEAVLAALVPAAAQVLTLTSGAARELQAAYGRAATVLPHPTLVDPRRSDDVATEPGLVVLHLKSLRRNLRDPVAIARATSAGARRAGGRLRVDVHPDVVRDPALVGLSDLAPEVELAIHDRFDDVALERYLRRAHVSVLPHRWGTHSGWLELARDLGTRVVAPDGGWYADQWDAVETYANSERTGLDADSLAAAVERAVRAGVVAPADPGARALQAEQVRAQHAEAYAQLLRAPRPDPVFLR